MLNHLDQFMDSSESQDDALVALLPMLGKKPEEDVTLKYQVNLIVDHLETNGAPVIVTFNPTYTNLMDETEYDSEFGTPSRITATIYISEDDI